MKTVFNRFRINGLFIMLAICLIAITSCKKENSFAEPDMPQVKTNAPSENLNPLVKTVAATSTTDLPDVDMQLCQVSPISRSDISPETPIEELTDGNGFSLSSGIVKINIAGKEVRLKGLTATFRFCENDRLIAIEGSAAIPSPIECIDFGEAAGTKIGFFTGHVINETLGLDFDLPADRAYFVFIIQTQLGASVCTDPNNPEERPIQIEIPGTSVNFKFITDFTDPFYYLEVPKMKVAESAEGVFNYVPVQPIPEMEPFAARSYVSGTYPMYGVLQINGHLYQNLPSVITQLTSDNPFDFPIEEGYKGGINGYFELGLPIGKDSSTLAEILSFSIPLGQASAAIKAVPIDGKIFSKAFLNTRIQPDNSWWPSFIPAKPNAEMDVTGFVQQDGQFRIGLRGEMGLQKSDNDKDLLLLAGELEATNEELRLRGDLQGPKEGWAINASIGKKQTDLNVEIPKTLTNNLSFSVKEEINKIIFEIDSISNLLSEAEKAYQFELSLRGLRDAIPNITSTARNKITDAVAKAKSDARIIIKSRIPKGYKLCSSPYAAIDDWIESIAQPYYPILNDLDAAVDGSLSNEAMRSQLENALRDLIDKKSVSASKTFNFVVGKDVVVRNPFTKKVKYIKKCGIKKTVSATISFRADVFDTDDVDLLNQAANNLQYIQPASDRVVQIGEVLQALPPRKVMVDLQFEVEAGAKKVPNLEKVGYKVQFNPSLFIYYAVLDGEHHQVEFDPFEWKSIVRMVVDKMKQE